MLRCRRKAADMQQPLVSVIVPLFNEEENVPILQSELGTALKGVDHEIIFVDDGSADRTVERIELAPSVRVIRFQKNAGQSAAIYAGLRAAHGATVVLIDGDLQNDPADISKLLSEIERGAQSRFVAIALSGKTRLLNGPLAELQILSAAATRKTAFAIPAGRSRRCVMTALTPSYRSRECIALFPRWLKGQGFARRGSL